MPAWSTPKTNWVDPDGFGSADANRIEQNTSDLRDATFRRVQGFGYTTDAGGVNYIKVLPGSCFTSAGVPLNFTSGGIKNLTAHQLGFGTSKGGMAPGVTVAANTWYYVFALGNSTTSDVEIMFDDNPAGSNVTLTNYPHVRYINSFKTDASSNVCEMYSTGDDVRINPYSMFTTRGVTYNNSALLENLNHVIQFTAGAEGFALPAREVEAFLEIRAGLLISWGFTSLIPGATGGNAFTLNPVFFDGTEYNAEFRGGMDSGINAETDTLRIMVNSSRTIGLGMTGNPANLGSVKLAVMGYKDLREIQ